MSIPRISLWLAATVAVVGALPIRAQSAAVVERQVQQLFEQRCAECHGRDLTANKRKGNKQILLDAQSTLVELDKVKALVLGNPADSSIIQKVVEPSEDDRMPPKGARLTTEQVNLLRQWIAGNTPATADGPPPSTAIKRADLFRAALADLQGAPASSRRYFRYLTLHNLRNAGDSAASLRADRAAVSKTLNSLSTESRIAVPVALGTDQVLLRFDLRDYGWDAAKWDLLAAAYPYEIEPALPTKTERDTRQATGTVLPIIRADWFVFAATQPPFYEQLLAAPGQSRLPDSDTKLEQQLGIQVLQNIRAGRVQRAAFTDSGVSDSNRMIERHALAGGGYYWKSYDFANERGAGDLIRNPLGPPETNYRRAFQHDGGEIIWSLPNGMQGYLLSTAKGDVIARGPTGIVKDPDGPQGAVMNGVSCMRCHSAGMRQPKGGEANVASTHRQAHGALDDTEQRLFDRLYSDAATVTRQLNDDGARFKAAARRAGVTEEAWFTQAEEPVSRLYGRFKSDITARTLASELDLDPADVQRQLREYEGAGDAQMNSLLQRLPKGIKRQNFIADFALLSRVFNLGQARVTESVTFEEFRETTRGEEVINSTPPTPASVLPRLPQSEPPPPAVLPQPLPRTHTTNDLDLMSLLAMFFISPLAATFLTLSICRKWSVGCGGGALVFLAGYFISLIVFGLIMTAAGK
jgi:mono/diheme cytochrome c family protein